MRPRNIIHARAITFELATTPSALGAGRGREFETIGILYKYMYLACTSREAPHFLALGQQVFWQQQLTRSFSLSGGAIKVASLYENYLLVLSTAIKMA